MTNRLASVLFAAALFAVPHVAETEEPPMKVVFFVVDGAGIGIWSIAQYQSDNHPIRQFPVVGLVDTRAATGYSPGSAAAATSFATGIRSFVRAIGVGPDSQPRESVLEVAQQRGLATGLVTTARITDATPASFSTHTAYRDDEPGIALQQLDQNVTVFMGGGRMHFAAGGRPDSLDLIGMIREHHTYVENGDQLGALALDSVTSLYGLFEWSDMPVYPVRSPSLTEMTKAALQVLDKDPDGFFLLLETENTDTELHHDVEFDVLAGEMLDVADAIRAVFDYQRSNPETLFILLGDHDTGGLAVQSASQVRVLNRTAARLDTVGVQLGESAGLLSSADLALTDSTRTLMNRTSELLRRRSRDLSDETMLVARYTTGSHTANLVPLFAKGPGAELFGGVIDNYAIGQILLEMVGRK